MCRREKSKRGTVLATWVLVAAAVRAGEVGLTVKEIEVMGTGISAATAQTIKNTLATKVGDAFSSEKVRLDMQQLLERGFFCSVVRREEVPGGLRLIYIVEENPRIQAVRFQGYKPSEDQKKTIGLKTREGERIAAVNLARPAEHPQIKDDVARLLKYFHDEGYAHAQVTPLVETGPLGMIVTFKIDAGSKVRLKEIRFVGNKTIPSKELLKLLDRSKLRLDKWYTSTGFSEEAVNEYVQVVQGYYRFKGLADATVTLGGIEYRGSDRSRAYATIQVDEGQTYTISSMAVQGNMAIGEQEILRAIAPLTVGSPYSPEAVGRAADAIESLYRKRGYAEVKCRPAEKLAGDGRSYAVSFNITEGESLIIDNMTTKGNLKTRQDVILREFAFQGLGPDKPYDGEKVDKAVRQLNNLRYFKSVKTELTPTEPPKPGRRNLQTEVEESETGMFLFGVGFSTSSALIGNISLEQFNFDWGDKPESWADFWSGNAFTGGGQYFRLALRPGTVQSEYSIEWQDPWFHDRPRSFGWRLFDFSRDQDTWTENRIGLGLNWSSYRQPVDPDTNYNYRVRLESVSVSSVDHDAPDDAFDAKGSHALLGFGLTKTRDRRDNIYSPTTGYNWELGGQAVATSGSYLELRASRTNYKVMKVDALNRKSVLSWGGTIGTKLGSPEIFERYYAGGAGSFRGFAYRGVSPHDNGEPVGGRSELLGTVEYRRPFYGDNIQIVYFTDFGTVTESLLPLTEPRLSVGFGFRISIPQLSREPFAIDFGFPLLKQSDDETEIISLSVSVFK